MGAGIAGEAAARYPDLPLLYGSYLEKAHYSTDVILIPGSRLILFPTKVNWKDSSILELIEKNAQQLVNRVQEFLIFNQNWPSIPHIYLPPPGCGLGRLKWEDVEPVISPILDDNFTVVFRD